MEALDVFVEVLSGVDAPEGAGDFYNRLCEAVCRLTSMERVVLFLYEEALRHVRAAGSHGLDPGLVAHVYGTLDEAPVAQRALAEDRVVTVSGDLEREVPARYARVLGRTTLTCTPLSAGGRLLGVLFADRGGGRYELTETETQRMWTLGKVAALAASARIATHGQEQAQRLSDRIDFAREVHESVIQRLFGVSLVLGAGGDLPHAERLRVRDEVSGALADLRSALRRPLAPEVGLTNTTLRAELDRLSEHPGLVLDVYGRDDVGVPPELEPLAQSVFAEAFRNAHKHADLERMEVRLGAEDGTFSLEVVNDGVRDGSRGSGLGLRLAAFEAVQKGGLVEYGPLPPDRWRVRLVVPMDEE